MENKNAEPGRDRREPYNQPIKIYSVVPKSIGDWSQIKKEAPAHRGGPWMFFERRAGLIVVRR